MPGTAAMSLGDLLEPMHEAVDGKWTFPTVVLRNAAGEAVSAEYDLGASPRWRYPETRSS